MIRVSHNTTFSLSHLLRQRRGPTGTLLSLLPMASLEDYEFNDCGAEAADTFPVKAGKIKKGAFLVINNHPCKVNEVTVSHPAKHGAAKCRFVGTDMFTGEKTDDIASSHDTVQVPFVYRLEYQLNNIDGGFLSLMNDAGEIREDLQLPTFPKEYGAQLEQAFNAAEENGNVLSVTVLQACNQEKVVAHRIATEE